jgi:aspartyl protease family protein
MATGFMEWRRVERAAHFSAAAAVCLLAAFSARATEVGVVGLFPGKAVLVIDGGNPRTLSVGAKAGDVKLIGVDKEAATLEFDGGRHRLTIGQHAYSGAESGKAGQSVTLTADARGHFSTVGTVNGATVRFLVDTGASMVSLGASDARRANIDIRNGEPGMAMTANGPTRVWKVKLNTIKVGDITMNEVDASVHAIDLPVALLGMSFLNRMEMKRDGETMTLRKRY